MTLSTTAHVLDGCWRVYTAVGRPVLHPSVLAALRRGGYVTGSPASLTARGWDVIDRLILAHQKTGTPLPGRE